MDSINIPGVLVGAVVSFLLGGLWYSKILFGELWHREVGGDPARAHHPAR